MGACRKMKDGDRGWQRTGYWIALALQGDERDPEGDDELSGLQSCLQT